MRRPGRAKRAFPHHDKASPMLPKSQFDPMERPMSHSDCGSSAHTQQHAYTVFRIQKGRLVILHHPARLHVMISYHNRKPLAFLFQTFLLSKFFTAEHA